MLLTEGGNAALLSSMPMPEILFHHERYQQNASQPPAVQQALPAQHNNIHQQLLAKMPNSVAAVKLAFTALEPIKEGEEIMKTIAVEILKTFFDIVTKNFTLLNEDTIVIGETSFLASDFDKVEVFENPQVHSAYFYNFVDGNFNISKAILSQQDHDDQSLQALKLKKIDPIITVFAAKARLTQSEGRDLDIVEVIASLMWRHNLN